MPSSPARAESMTTGTSRRRAGRPAAPRSSPKPSRLGIITSVSDEVGRVARGRSSSATRAVGAPSRPRSRLGEQRRDVVAHVGVVVDDEHARPLVRRRGGARPLASSGLEPAQRLGDEALGVALARVGAAASLTTWSAGRCSAPNGTRTVNVEPSPGALLDRDAAAVQLGQLGDERQPDARALVGARARADDAVEALEQPLLVGRLDADAGVGDRQLGAVAVGGAQPHRDPARRT